MTSTRTGIAMTTEAHAGAERRLNCMKEHQALMLEMKAYTVSGIEFTKAMILLHGINDALIGTMQDQGLVSKIRDLEKWRGEVDEMVKKVIAKSIGIALTGAIGGCVITAALLQKFGHVAGVIK